MTDVVLKEEAARDKTFARVWKEYEKFRKGNDAWSALSEAAYARAKNM
jgi:TRAP-type mannitol/chloroaromatic compound transport system substrate-binding protein